eukprot:2295594-Karenia_brevis.AAC.1
MNQPHRFPFGYVSLRHFVTGAARSDNGCSTDEAERGLSSNNKITPQQGPVIRTKGAPYCHQHRPSVPREQLQDQLPDGV